MRGKQLVWDDEGWGVGAGVIVSDTQDGGKSGGKGGQREHM
jgi:hypothetical protein